MKFKVTGAMPTFSYDDDGNKDGKNILYYTEEITASDIKQAVLYFEAKTSGYHAVEVHLLDVFNSIKDKRYNYT